MNSQMERERGHVKRLRHRGLCPHRVSALPLLAHGCSTQKLSEPCPFSGFISCMENARDRGAWWSAVYGVAQSRTGLKWLSSSSVDVSLRRPE